MISCRPPFADESDQVLTELHNQAKSNEGAGKIRSQPARIMDHLQNGNFVRELVIIFIEAGLIIRFAVVTKRIVHVDLDFAILPSVRALKADDAGKVLRNVSAAIALVSERFELERKR